MPKDLVTTRSRDSSLQDYVSVSNVAELQALPRKYRDGAICELEGYYTAGDGGGGRGILRNSAFTADGGTVFGITGMGGNWHWEREVTGTVDVRWFGAVGDGATDNATAIQDACDASLDV